jgi:molybdopterin-guanine dinucleotide biosynthesis protein A
MKSAVILAGGRSTRMGLDKSSVDFRGNPLIYWVYAVFRDVADELIISVSGETDTIPIQRILEGEFKIVRDEKPDLGPISGLQASFTRARGEYVAVAPCDSPFIKRELYLRLFELAIGADGAVPEVNGYWEPIHAVYRRDAMIDAIKKALAEGKTRTKDTYGYLKLTKLEETTIKSFDPELHSFVNINSLADLAKASDEFKDISK